MAATKGNRFWEARSSHGRKPKFASPGDLMNACTEYFKWVDDNPLYEQKLVKYKDYCELKKVPKLRAMTMASLCMFIDISHDTLRNYAKKSEDFLAVVRTVENTVREQKFAGAAADLFNANIIARDLGLRDQTPVEVVVHNHNTAVDEETLKERGLPVPSVSSDDVDD